MKKFTQEFKEFALKGNMFDMAVGIIIGAAFGKIVASLVADIIMPVLSLILGNINISAAKLLLKEGQVGPDGAVLVPELAITYGVFFKNIIDFLVIALVIFLLIKAINKLRHQEAKKTEAPKVEKPSEEVVLLREIRDSLKK